jgi:hypothetical protein
MTHKADVIKAQTILSTTTLSVTQSELFYELLKCFKEGTSDESQESFINCNKEQQLQQVDY